jgi:hypothetical protein
MAASSIKPHSVKGAPLRNAPVFPVPYGGRAHGESRIVAKSIQLLEAFIQFREVTFG